MTPVVKPRTFFLNEQHELAPELREGGGGTAKLAAIDWEARAERVHDSLLRVRRAATKSSDPVRDHRYYVLTLPMPSVTKLSVDKKKAPDGTYEEPTDYRSGAHSMVFRRLGLDLLDVHDDGTATVHATRERFEQLISTSKRLPEEGPRAQARWVTIDAFSPISSDLKVDRPWLDRVSPGQAVDAVVELQPLLSRAEAQSVLKTMAEMLREDEGERFSSSGSDFSGRYWFRGQLKRQSIELIAEALFSVQSIHPPLRSLVAAGPRRKLPSKASTSVVGASRSRQVASTLPVIAVVDTGVPQDHVALGPFRRGGGYRYPGATAEYIGNHGSRVASVAVFGDVDLSTDYAPPTVGTCAFYDVMLAWDAQHIEDKGLLPALEAVVATAPDVRVFNLSFGDGVPLAQLNEVERRERLNMLRDLDNFVFARDVVVVVAAGNTRAGVLPSTAYPEHIHDPAWALGVSACGFNTLTCGATVERLTPDGLVKNLGWPSPFTRIGPGIGNSPVPDFAANGGNTNSDYHWGGGLGVWCCDANGDWEDHCGTSLAAPLVAREAAFAFELLRAACPPGTKPFATTVKSFLALTASPASLPARHREFERRAIGYGRPRASRLATPAADSAVFVWQSVLEGPRTVSAVRIPIPQSWLRSAELPVLRLACSWDSPANEAAERTWASRKVHAKLRAPGISNAIGGSKSQPPSYPLFVRTFDLRPERVEKGRGRIAGDEWILEVEYAQTADYYPGMIFSPQQRVSVALELKDMAEDPVSPQAAIQGLPVAATLLRLGSLAVPLATPIAVKVSG